MVSSLQLVACGLHLFCLCLGQDLLTTGNSLQGMVKRALKIILEHVCFMFTDKRAISCFMKSIVTLLCGVKCPWAKNR